MMYGPMIFS